MANFNYNLVVIAGRLTKEPELKQTQSGMPICSFTVAINRKAKRGEQDRQTDFISCKAFEKQAEFLTRYFHKGSSISVTGRISSGAFTDQEGNKKYVTEVIANEILFVDGAKDGQNGQNGQSASGEQSEYNPYGSSGGDDGSFSQIASGEDLPF